MPLSSNKKFFWLLLLTALYGLFILWPYHNFQLVLAQGDHGRELYCFKATFDGAVPYRDYFWEYGPLMPYYYKYIIKFLGNNIQSILAGKLLLQWFSGILIFLTLCIISSPVMGFLAALWFWALFPDFQHTYTYAGGIFLLIMTIYFLFIYMQKNQHLSLYLCLVTIFFLSLVKVNFGISALLSLILSVAIIDQVNNNPISNQKKIFYILSLIFLPLVIYLTYFALLYDLPLYSIRQCLPYLKAYRVYQISFIEAIMIFKDITFSNITSAPHNILFAGLIIMCIILNMQQILIKNYDLVLKKKFFLTMCVLFIFYIASLHEFIVSGMRYRMFWAIPFTIIMIFIIVYYALKNSSKFLRTAFFIMIFFIVILNTNQQHNRINLIKLTQSPLIFNNKSVFVGNSPQWMNTVNQTTKFLKENLENDELFLAFPFDVLYYYLTEKKSPTWQLRFFNQMNIPPEQEKTIIEDLEKNGVNIIVMSNRLSSKKGGLGTFGETFCPLLKQFVDKNFVHIKDIGELDDPADKTAGWTRNHTVTILKRKN